MFRISTLIACALVLSTMSMPEAAELRVGVSAVALEAEPRRQVHRAPTAPIGWASPLASRAVQRGQP